MIDKVELEYSQGMCPSLPQKDWKYFFDSSRTIIGTQNWSSDYRRWRICQWYALRFSKSAPTFQKDLTNKVETVYANDNTPKSGMFYCQDVMRTINGNITAHSERRNLIVAARAW